MKRAFTLVELLVVIAILAILAAILFPVFSRVRENGRRAACQSNLKQIGLGLMQYSQDYDEILCPDWFVTNPNTALTTQAASTPNARYKWTDAIFPYTKSEQIFTCPSATDKAGNPWHFYGHLAPGTETDDFGSYIIMHGYGPTSVAASGFLVCANNGCTPPVSHPLSDDLVNLSQAAKPSRTAWVLDGDGQFYSSIDPSTNTVNNVVDRHLGTLGVLFLDGHVKSIRLSDLNHTNSKGIVSMATVQDD